MAVYDQGSVSVGRQLVLADPPASGAMTIGAPERDKQDNLLVLGVLDHLNWLQEVLSRSNMGN